MSEEHDNHDNDFDSNQWGKEEQSDEGDNEESDFVFFDFISRFFDWLFKQLAMVRTRFSYYLI